jgi:outer membrane immunogenic protein
MRRFAIVGIGLLSLGGFMQTARAADPPSRPSPEVAAPVYNWGGLYAGANAGWGSSHDNRFNPSDGHDLGSYDASGGVVGGQAGYRWQFGSWVFGLEAQGNWADVSGSSLNAFGAASTIRSKMDAFGLFTAQVGYAWTNVLLYAKGGASVTDRDYQFLDTAAGTFVSSSGYQTRWSGAVGVGLEYGFAPNWSAALEYDHIFEDRHTTSFVTTASPSSTLTYASGGDTDLVTVRVNYHFGNTAIPYY